MTTKTAPKLTDLYGNLIRPGVKIAYQYAATFGPSMNPGPYGNPGGWTVTSVTRDWSDPRHPLAPGKHNARLTFEHGNHELTYVQNNEAWNVRVLQPTDLHKSEDQLFAEHMQKFRERGIR
jgi:hypothetical protein